MALNTDLVSYWSLQGNSLDSHGTNHGTADVDLTYAAAKIGNGFQGNATGTPHIELPSSASLDIYGDLSISCWTYATNGSPYTYFGTNPLITFLDAAGGTGAYRLLLSSGQVFFGVVSPGPELASGTVAAANIWNHIVATRAGSTLRIYVNGADVANRSDGGAAESALGGAVHRIGAISASDCLGLQLDELGIWGRALSPSEVLELYNGGAGLAYSAFGPLTELSEFPAQFPWGQEGASTGPTAASLEKRLAQYLQGKPNVEAILRAL